ncbi:hypothetical protein COV53_01715 [Candidatus Gottesmanbacteria bacterium CG11_big_fil_rev_8_21_14_0_20_37_11]|uniref:Uncharacterized protein n=2 Tax=Candidatus Gottesmaniibacteriota TaxID=1752720 RepID=A0A2M7RQX4_9BACT|nr:MAG: hypothetical protein COX23_05315 [Candidatus Gottesmanbacteria bacterium CG23_combo_of_CG06-09_8_20_14_all_37_19]PIR08699.1 MAG: hypothetical protein COV53_01715 [Candidatus Gottesmanbacteria bacterium CG11_big_fil_rev_8_21_14_0_20_37_11]PIZ02439.1 MAG: hypothetical protein COY59_04815 [Candidatus Gottesmanbacteria bacterium CG_4_10_14_0_8_um_filter_37_24]
MEQKEITTKQLVANKQNALKGGVKSPKGKAISRYNAMKHGLLCNEVLIEGEDEKTLLQLERSIRAAIQPVGELELLLTDRIIANIWRLKRAMKVERNSMEWHKNYESPFEERSAIPLLDFQKSREKISEMIANGSTERILRYETTIERGIYKALHELQRIQAARAGDKPFTPLAIDLDVSGDL